MYIEIIITYFVKIRAQIKKITFLKYMIELLLLYVNVCC